MKKFAALGIALLLAGCGEYSDGVRIGTIQKFSYKGLVAKTWEGEMLLGGLKRKTSTDSNGNSSTSMVANIWAFTVEDPALIARAPNWFFLCLEKFDLSVDWKQSNLDSSRKPLFHDVH